MNLYYQFKAFYERVVDTPLKAYHVPVYFTLLYMNNRCGWKPKFTVAYGEVLHLAKVDAKTYYKALKALQECGFITFSKGANQYSMCEITIKVLYDISLCTDQSTTLSTPYALPKALPNADTNALPNNHRLYTIDNKTKDKGHPANIEEVVAYFLELRIKDHLVQADKFFNFYEAKGWKIGKNDIKNWKACVKTWKLEREEDKPAVKRALTKEEYYKAFAG